MNYKREVYLSAVKTQLDTNIFNHSLALEACMSGLYNYFKNNNLLDINEPSKDEWMLAGLIHDIDFSGDYKQFHPTKTREVLSKFNLEISDRIYNTIQAHDSRISGIKCTKKLVDVKISSVLKRLLHQPKFASGTRRDEVEMCSNPQGLNLSLEKFVEICLTSMQKIAFDIGL